jgi:hypothetical protein
MPHPVTFPAVNLIIRHMNAEPAGLVAWHLQEIRRGCRLRVIASRGDRQKVR